MNTPPLKPFDLKHFEWLFGDIIETMRRREELERDGEPRYSRNHMEAEQAEGLLELND